MKKISDLYGIERSFNFIKEIIDEKNPQNVLDIGCGTGSNITSKLAKSFPNVQFLGIDTDLDSINYAKQYESNNLQFLHLNDIKLDRKFELIIASEVIEHVDEPSEFLLFLRKHLSPKGKLILTLPNGYGPKEIVSAIEAIIIILLDSLSLKNKVKAILRNDAHNERSTKYATLARSPHVNFFSYSEILNIFNKSGFRVIKYRPRTFLCGFGFDQIFKGDKLLNWNANISDMLPPQLNSGWIFVLQTTDKYNKFKYKRNLYSLIKKLLSTKKLYSRNPSLPDHPATLVC